MLSRRTVFVVGAGASRELNLPIGEELKGWIAAAIQVQRTPNGTFANAAVESAVRSYVSDEDAPMQQRVYQQFGEAAAVITRALPFALSIDQYLDSQRDNPIIVKLGKIGIAASILKAESKSSLGKSVSPGAPDLRRSFPSEAGKTWHLKLVQLLTAGRPKADVKNVFEDVAFIVFNYDRCLEQYLSLALTQYYGEGSPVIRQALQSLTILHPYGQVGSMNWQNGTTVPFGGEADGMLRSVADGILTFTESAEDGVTADVKALIQGAETVVFMGFGFLPQNVQLLTANRRSNASRVFYTTKGISKSDTDFVESDLEVILQKEAASPLFQIDAVDAFNKFQEPETCLDLMNNNWMRLTR